MEEKQEKTNILDTLKNKFSKVFSKTVLIIIGVITLVLLLSGGGSFAYTKSYQNRIAPNVWIGLVSVEGLNHQEAVDKVQERVDNILLQGLKVTLEKETKEVSLSTISVDDAVDDVEFNVEEVVNQALNNSHKENPILNIVELIKANINEKHYQLNVDINQESLTQSLDEVFTEAQILPINSRLTYKRRNGKWSAKVTKSSTGKIFDFDPFFFKLQNNLNGLKNPKLKISLVAATPAVNEKIAENVMEIALKKISESPYKILYQDEGNVDRIWKIDDLELSEMLLPTANTELPLSIDQTTFDLFLNKIATEVERDPKNARFEIEEGKVTEFSGSRPGITIDREATTLAFEKLLNDVEIPLTAKESKKINKDTGEETNKENKTEITKEIRDTINLTVVFSSPEITTGDVNDLGITEMLGVGISSYRGSPRNRIKNIRNGINLLNGTLLAPGETLSLVQSLRPFTNSNGYLPELVIKGDKIEAEMGGGLCQIGTTTFRATMNSGLEVTERRNHSLVVSYYNDMANGNPGTDATIYEPHPDYKLTNDTENWILFQAEMLEDRQELRFSFWGTSDGRKGYYSPPEVIRWKGTGPTKTVVTPTLKPGQRKCQGAHVGADTSFTYYIERPDGEIEETIFTSSYRALPTICLVGEEKPETSKEPEVKI